MIFEREDFFVEEV